MMSKMVADLSVGLGLGKATKREEVSATGLLSDLLAF